MGEFTPNDALLSPLQQRFVDEYLINPSSPTACARRAGYSDDSAKKYGSQLLRLPKVKAAIEEAQAARSHRMGITQDRVLQELARIAFANLQDIVSENDDGETTVNLKRLSRDSSAALGEVSVSETKGKVKVRTSKIRLHDKLGALEKIAKHLGMFTEKHEHTIMTLEDLVRQSMVKQDEVVEDVLDVSDSEESTT